MKAKIHKWTKEQDDLMYELVPGNFVKDVMEKFNEKYPEDPLTYSMVKSWKIRHNMPSGLDMRFKKGQESYNKNKKGLKIPGSEKGWFKKGNRPANHKEVGTVVMGTIGYLMIKTEEPNKWELLHRVVWEKEKGKIPKGYVVAFRDNNHNNCNIDNLVLVPRRIMAEMTKEGFHECTNELKDTALLVCESNVKIRQLRKKGDKKCSANVGKN